MLYAGVCTGSERTTDREFQVRGICPGPVCVYTWLQNQPAEGSSCMGMQAVDFYRA